MEDVLDGEDELLVPCGRGPVSSGGARLQLLERHFDEWVHRLLACGTSSINC